MARVNQGAYKIIRNEHNELVEQGIQLLSEYFDTDGLFEGDYISLWCFLKESNDCYEKLQQNIFKIKNMLYTQKFEQENKICEYEKLVVDADNLCHELRDKANSLIQMVGPEFSDLEQYSLNKMSILNNE